MLTMKHTTARGVENVTLVYTNLSTKMRLMQDLFTGGLVETAFLNQRTSITGNSLDLGIQ